MAFINSFKTSLKRNFQHYLDESRVRDAQKNQAFEVFEEFLAWKKDFNQFGLPELAIFLDNKNLARESEGILLKNFVRKAKPGPINTFLTNFLQSLAETGVSDTTVRNYRSDIRQFIKHSQSQTLKQLLTREKLDNFVEFQINKKLKKSSIDRKIVSINRFATFIENQAIIDQDLSWLTGGDYQFERYQENHEELSTPEPKNPTKPITSQPKKATVFAQSPFRKKTKLVAAEKPENDEIIDRILTDNSNKPHVQEAWLDEVPDFSYTKPSSQPLNLSTGAYETPEKQKFNQNRVSYEKLSPNEKLLVIQNNRSKYIKKINIIKASFLALAVVFLFSFSSIANFTHSQLDINNPNSLASLITKYSPKPWTWFGSEPQEKLLAQAPNFGKILGAKEDLRTSKLVFNIPTSFKAPIEILSLDITDNLGVGGDLDITGNTTLGGTLDVTGETTLTGLTTTDLTASGTSTFNGTATFTQNITATGVNLDLGSGQLTAGNVVYSIAAGDGLTVSGTQEVTISLDDDVSAENLELFSSIDVDGTTISAGSNDDKLTLESGTGITLSASGKTITIASENISGWTESGTVVSLTTATDKVGIGTAAPTAQLQIGAGTPSYADGANDLYVAGDLEVAGTIYGTVSVSFGFSEGSVAFADSGGNLAEDNDNFYWDDTNNYLGIGTTNPSQALHIYDGNILAGYSGNTINSSVTGSAILGGGKSGTFITRGLENSIGTTANNHSVIVGGNGNALTTNSLSENFIGGGELNTIGDLVHWSGLSGTGDSIDNAVIVGGEGNLITGYGRRGFIGGGYWNIINDDMIGHDVIGGGYYNRTTGNGYSTIAGGAFNQAAHYSAIGGGTNHIASGNYTTIPGGRTNTASGYAATALAGRENVASGDYSYAAGYNAVAAHTGAFVYSYDTTTDFSSELAEEFAINAGGGLRLVVDGSNDLFRVFDNTDEVFTILDGGNVGIGTTSPSYNLDVYDATDDILAGFTSGDALAGIQITDSSDTAYLLTQSSTLSIGMTNSLSSNNLNINSSGNVGIGATNPGAKLHISGGDILLDNTYSVQFKSSGGTATDILTVDSGDNTLLATPTGGDVYFKSGSNYVARFRSNGQINLGGTSAISNPLAIILSDGSVGIGLTNPSYKLQVAGTGYFSDDLTVDNNTFHVDAAQGYIGLGTTSPNYQVDINALASTGVIFNFGYQTNTTLTGDLTGAKFNLDDGYVTATNQNVTGLNVKLPTVTNSHTSGTKTLRGFYVDFGTGAGIGNTGAGTTNYNAMEATLPALTQSAGTLTTSGAYITTPSSITTGGTANGFYVNASGVAAGTLRGLSLSSLTPGAGTEQALYIGEGWDAVLQVGNTQVINSSGVTQEAGGGTGQYTYSKGDILYASADDSLARLAIGNTTNYVLTVSAGGVPTWGTVSGSTCTNCLVTDPSSSQIISPTADASGLIVRQSNAGSPTADIFAITDNSGSTKYFYVDSDGNINTGAGSIASDSLTLAPLTNKTALSLIGTTEVTTATLFDIEPYNVSGRVIDLDYGSAQTLTGDLVGFDMDLATNVTATGQSVLGAQITLPASTNTHTSGTKYYRGLVVAPEVGGGYEQNGSGGTTIYSAADLQMPAITQTDGTLTANGLLVTTPSSITTAGTANAINISATGIGAGTLYGINIGNISSPSTGDEIAFNIGTGWDYGLYLQNTGSNYLAGKLGIGTTNPTVGLAVGSGTPGSVSASNDAYITGNLEVDGEIYADITGAITIGDTQGAVLFTGVSGEITSNDAYFHWDNSNNRLGIGVTDPDSPLEVKGTTQVKFSRDNYGFYTSIDYDDVTNNTSTLVLNSSTASGGYLFKTSNASNNQVDALAIDRDGNVGIGTTSPGAPLHIESSAMDAGGTGLILGFNSDYYHSIESDVSTNAANNYLGINVSSGLGTRARVLTLRGSGNVGIGTTSPGAKLHVSGGEIFLDNTQGLTFQSSAGGSAIASEIDTDSSNDLIISYNKANGGDQIYFTQGSGEAKVVTIDSNGNLGIGDTTPSYSLDVYHATNDILAGFTSGDALAGIQITDSSDIAYLLTQDSTLSLGMANSLAANNINIDTSGYLGIGTTNPETPLHLELSSTGPAITLDGTDSSNGLPRIHFQDNGTNKFSMGLENSTDNFYITQSAFSQANVLFTIENAGNVGIGDTNPAQKLTVAAPSGYPANSGTTQNGVLRIKRNDTGANIIDFGLVGAASPYAGWIQVTNKNDLSINYPLALNPNGGNVGIGTTNPGAKLHVSEGDVLLDNTYSVQFKSGGGTATDILTVDSGDNTLLATPTGGDVYFKSGSNYVARFRSNGQINLGGTSAISNPLAIILSDGSMGIGDTTPSYRLDAYHATGDIIAQFASGDALAGIQITDSSDTAYLLTQDSTLSIGMTSSLSTSNINIDASGYLGIGTIAPDVALHVVNTSEQLRLAYDAQNYASFTVNSAGTLTIGVTGTDAMSFSSSKITSHLPHEFLASGDVSMAYDLNFTNQTSSYINSNAPLYLVAGESYESNDLTLKTYNYGDVVLDMNNGNFVIGATSPSIVFDNATSGETDFWMGIIGIGDTSDNDKFSIGDGNNPDNNSFLTIDTSGNVGIGTTSPTATLEVAGTVAIGDTSSNTYKLNVERSDAGIVAAFKDSDGVCTVDPTGGMTCTSDINLKKDVETLPSSNALAIVNQLSGIKYHSLSESESDEKHFGFSAQDVELVAPELVETLPNGYKGINYDRFAPILAGAIQEVDSKVDDYVIPAQAGIQTIIDSGSGAGMTLVEELGFLNTQIADLNAAVTQIHEELETNRLSIGTTASQELVMAITSSNTGSIALLNNTDASETADLLDLQLGAETVGTNNSFVTFKNGAGEVIGQITGNGTGGVSYQTAGADFAEYFPKVDPQEKLEPGDIVCLHEFGGVKKCGNVIPAEAGIQTDELDSSSEAGMTNPNIIGVVSAKAGFVGNSEYADSPNYVLVGILGQLPVKLSSNANDIKAGDPLTVGPDGKAIKATSAGQIIGHVISANVIPAQAGIQVYVNPTYYVGSLTASGNVTNNVIPAEAGIQTAELDSSSGLPAEQAGAGMTDALFTKLETSLKKSLGEDDETRMGELEETIKDLKAQIAQLNEKVEQAELPSQRLIATDLVIPAEAGIQTNADLEGDVLGDSTVVIPAEAGIQTAELDSSSGLPAEQAGAGMTDGDMGGEGALLDLGYSLIVDRTALQVGQLMLGGESGTMINSTSVLELQPYGQAGISLVAGLVNIDTDGNVKIAGNLQVEGKVTAGKLAIGGQKNVIPAEAGIQTAELDSSSEAGMTDGDQIGEESLGSAVLPAGQTSLIIKTTALSKDSKIFTSLTSSSGGQSLIVQPYNHGKHQELQSTELKLDLTGKAFVVSVEQAHAQDIGFDWWIVDQVAE